MNVEDRVEIVVAEGTGSATRSRQHPGTRRFRSSAAFYITALMWGTVFGLWAGYLSPSTPVLWGQAAAVIVPMAAAGVSFTFWLVLEPRQMLKGWPLGFVVLLGGAWLANLASFRFHGDAFTYGALAFLPILVMLALKPPTEKEGASVLILAAWAISLVLTATRLLQVLGVIPVKSQPANVIEFDEENYWLPLNDLLGIDGRWPGPFGHNGYTAMMAAFIIVIAVVFWTRASWVFLTVGVFTLLVTSGRASAGAAVLGIVAYAMFTHQGRLGRVPRMWRIPTGSAILAGGVVVLFSGSSGLTGRQNIWPAFWDLWLTSPVMGVGTSGIAASGGLTQAFGHAHNMYLDLLTRNGLVAFLLVMTALALGLGITLVAALRGQPGPLALLAAYLVTAVTEPRNDWLHPGALVLMSVLCVLTAAAFSSSRLTTGASHRSPTPTVSSSQ
jgi:hypothetical protein